MKFQSKVTLKWDGEEVKVRGKKYVGESALEAGIIIQNQAVVLCPVDQGRLRGSIFLKTKDRSIGNSYSGKALSEDLIEAPEEENVVYVGTNVRYASYVEYGTRKSAMQPFMRPAFDLSQGKILTIIKENGKQVFKEYLKT